MSSLPEYLERGEKARLFPVLADTSKEGRSTSILLSCLVHVREFGQVMLGSVDKRVGKLASLAAYTEVIFADRGEEKAHRPDGLIVLRLGKRWSKRRSAMPSSMRNRSPHTRALPGNTALTP